MRLSREFDGGLVISLDAPVKHSGIAGSVSVSARVAYTYDDGEVQESVWILAGSIYGGPVVAVLPDGSQEFVSDPERFGRFADDPCEYLRRYVLDERD